MSEVRFGRYRSLELLGQGGMADVCRAYVDGPGGFSRQVAIKRIHHALARQPDFVQMLTTEARVTALLHHPSIVQVYEFGEIDGEYYLAMELAEGPDLRLVMRTAHERQRLMPPGVACYLIGQLADALAYAHTLRDSDGRPLGIVHRDISPSNVIVTLLGGVKLLDFGIAKAAAQLRGDELTRNGEIKGKVGYLSPEQIELLPLDHRCDQYALGIVFWEALTAQRLFKALTRPPGSPPPPSQLAPGIDAEIDAIVLKMLAGAPDDRFADCGEVARALAPLARRLQGDALALKEWLAATGPFDGAIETPEPHPGEVATQLGHRPAVARSTGSATGQRRVSRWLWLGVVGSGVLSALLGFELMSRLPPPVEIAPPAARPAPVVAPPLASPAPMPATAPPEPLKLRLEGTAGAAVLLDDQPAGQMPLALFLPRVAQRRRVTVRLDGYETWTRDIAGDVDVLLFAALTPVAPPQLARPPRPSSRPASHPSRSSKWPPEDGRVVRDPFH